MAELFPDRFEAETGEELDNCVNVAGERLWGDACTAAITEFRATNAIGALPLYESIYDANGTYGADGNAVGDLIVCHENNDAGNPTFTGLDNCDLVELGNGLFRWEWKADITCINPIDNNRYGGFSSCLKVDGTW